MSARLETEEEKTRFLKEVREAARVLALSLDYEATIAGLAQLSVPTFADWCFVDLVTEDGDAFDRVAVGSSPRSRYSRGSRS